MWKKKLNKKTRICDRPSLPDSNDNDDTDVMSKIMIAMNDNVKTKSSSQTKEKEERVDQVEWSPLKMLKIPKLSVHEFRIGDPVWVKMKGRDSPGKVCKKS